MSGRRREGSGDDEEGTPSRAAVSNTRPPADRLDTLDIARAMVIIGVVFNHIVDGLLGASIVGRTSNLASVNDALYVFRMPALTLMLGLLIPRSVSRRGVRGYLKSRLLTMGYLYLVWTLIQGSSELLGNGVRNGERSVISIFEFWRPIAHLWFLPFIVVASVVVVLAAPWKSLPRTWLTMALLTLVSLITWGWAPPVAGVRGLALVVFVAVGATIGEQHLMELLRLPLARSIAVLSMAGAVFAFGIYSGAVSATRAAPVGLVIAALSIVTALCGTILVFGVAQFINGLAPARGLLVMIGKQTLPIYLSHVIVVSTTRVALVSAGVSNPAIILLVALVLGVSVPLLAVKTCRRLALTGLFELPGWISRRVFV